MTMPSSGAISLSQANVELGYSSTANISLNTAAVRTLAGVASGAISISNLYGKSNLAVVSYTFTSNTQNASLNLSGLGGYSAGKTDFTVTVNSGVYLWASTTGNYGLNLTGATTGDTVTLVNNGFIMGCGGSGNVIAGGPAFNVGIGTNITLDHTSGTGYIGGGGGSGRGSAQSGMGGGAGGGAGDGFCQPGGAGGTIGNSGARGNNGYTYQDPTCASRMITVGQSGGGGGRIFPGVGGSGGPPSYGSYPNNSAGYGGGAGGGGAGYSANGGGGGSSNSAGGNGVYSLRSWSGGGGGGWGASGGSSNGGGGGAGGKAINLNGKTITYVSGNSDRVWGAVS